MLNTAADTFALEAPLATELCRLNFSHSLFFTLARSPSEPSRHPGWIWKLGLKKTGLIGFSSLTSMLTLCVASIWLEGSPFEPFYFQNKRAQVDISILSNNTGSSKFRPTDIFFANQTDTGIMGDSSCYVSSFISVSVLLCGIILARFGLWVSDLTVTQILQVMLYLNL